LGSKYIDDKKQKDGEKEYNRLNWRFQFLTKLYGEKYPHAGFWKRLYDTSNPIERAIIYHESWKLKSPSIKKQCDDILSKLDICIAHTDYYSDLLDFEESGIDDIESYNNSGILFNVG